MIVSFCQVVHAKIKLEPVNPPIEKWSKKLIVSPVSNRTQKEGYLAMTRGRALIVVGADQGKQKASIQIGLSQYTVTNDGKIYVAEYGTGLFSYNLSQGSERKRIQWKEKDLTDISRAPLYSSSQKQLYVITESGGIYFFKDGEESGTLSSDATSKAARFTSQFTGSPLASLIKKSKHHAGLLVATANGTLHWLKAKKLDNPKTFSVGGAAFFSPVSYENFVYVLVRGRVLTAIDLNGNKKPIWQYSLPGVATANVVVGAVIGGGRLAYVPINSTLYALRVNKRRCELEWKKNFRDTITQSVALYRRGKVLVATTDVQALDAETGKEIWSYNKKISQEKDKYIYEQENKEGHTLNTEERQRAQKKFPQINSEINNPLKIIGDVIYCTLASGRIIAFSEKYSKFLYWVHEPKDSFEASPITASGHVLSGSTRGKIYAMTKDGDGKVKENSIGNESIVGLIPADDTVLVVTRSGRVHKLVINPSKTLGLRKASGWENPISLLDEVRVCPAFDGKTLYIPSVRNGKIYAVDTESRSKSAELLIGAPMKSSPRLCNDMLVLGTDNGDIKGIKVAEDTHLRNTFLKEDWSITVGAPISGGVSKPDSSGYVYVGDVHGVLHAINASNGSKDWEVTIASNVPIRTTPNLDSTGVYVTCDDGTIAHFTYEGKEEWSVKPHGEEAKPLSPILYDTRILLVPFQDGQIYALSKTDGTKRWHYELGKRIKADAIKSGKDIYIATLSGTIFVVSPQLLSEW